MPMKAHQLKAKKIALVVHPPFWFHLEEIGRRAIDPGEIYPKLTSSLYADPHSAWFPGERPRREPIQSSQKRITSGQ